MLSLPAGAYDENFERGSLTFPFDYHFINKRHPRFIMPFHYHIDHELIRIVKGGLSITLNERHYHLKEGDFLFISDGVVHGGHPDSASDIYECVVFNLSKIFDTTKPNTIDLKRLITHQIQPKELFYKEENSKFSYFIDAFFDIVKTRADENTLLAQGLLLTILGNIFYLKEFTAKEEQIASRYLKYLNKTNVLFRYIFDNYDKDITLDDMSATVNLNPKYFCKFFKELTGKRPMDYLNAFRVDCAAVKLQAPTESINQIAYACGFKDPAYFTKLFKRYKKISPRDFRKSCLSQKDSS